MVEKLPTELAAAFIHKRIAIDAMKIFELYMQKCKRRFDFGS